MKLDSVLESYVEQWGLPTWMERREKRLASSFAELKAFHDALLPEAENIIEFLNQFPPDDIPKPYRKLSYAVLALSEVDRPVNRWGQVILESCVDARRILPKASFYDR